MNLTKEMKKNWFFCKNQFSKMGETMIELDADLAQDLGRELIAAVKLPNWDHATMLLDLGADVNYLDDRGWTPLTAVAEKGDFILVNKLLDRGANPNLPDKYGWTPLMKMAGQGEKEDLVITRILLNRGANLNLPTKKWKNGSNDSYRN